MTHLLHGLQGKPNSTNHISESPIISHTLDSPAAVIGLPRALHLAKGGAPSPTLGLMRYQERVKAI